MGDDQFGLACGQDPLPVGLSQGLELFDEALGEMDRLQHERCPPALR
jgi:hypothetical protein